LLIASPTDAFRLFNLSQIDAGAFSGGMAAASGSMTIPVMLPLVSLLLWPLLAMTGAMVQFRRYQP
jgi:Cu-processing system permease protein